MEKEKMLTPLNFLNTTFDYNSIFNQLSHLDLKGVFYPLSVFINEFPFNMCEYVAAKMVGEVFCTMMENH